MVRDHLPAGRIGAGHLETLLDGWRRDRPEAPGYLALAGVSHPAAKLPGDERVR